MTNSLFIGPGSGLTSLSPAARDPLRAQREARLQEAKAAVQTLRQQSSTAADQRKAAAKKKVEDLKARIQALKMSMPADPKAAARLVAQMARELGAAVKAYGGTGGSMTDLASAGVPAAPAADGLETSQTESSATVADKDIGDNGPASTGESGEDEKASPADPYRKALETQQSQAADQARKAEGVKADSEFVATVRGLASDLKAMAKKAEADAKRSGENGSDPDAASASLDAVESEVNRVAGSLTGGMVSLMV